MKAIIVGGSGQVARALKQTAARLGVPTMTLERPEVDLCEPMRATDLIAQSGASVVFNAAAYTAVDRAELEPELAFQINAAGAEAVARGAERAGAVLVHFSTDYVFDGSKKDPYAEDDATGPTGVYGRSKLEGERLVLEACGRAVVLRTAWVFDASGANFVRTMLRLARNREEVGVVADQQGCPTFAQDLADAAFAVSAQGGPLGVYHCVGGGAATWADFAGEIFTQSRARGGPSARVRPIATAEFPTPAKRPANSRLDCGKLARVYGVRLRPWRVALGECLNEIAYAGWRVE
ncbi:MAG: dTDP-4-dehydrorhamnose reductase [Hyphomonadaceae bacterium]|nr:dTDP-4-dehydrorhamnose reductase [Hyphomonadaceae bacterium]